jgi:CDP-2,3-bis-(O-geranylgeranyl)-sn-glycerol synthase
MTWRRLIDLLYLMLPLYTANMAPPFARYWHGWNRPISERWLGTHKTVLGFGLGILTAIGMCWLQSRLAWQRSLLDYSSHWFALGVSTGVAAMAGDSLKSFFKRRLAIEPGKPWIPFDQLDFVVAGLIVLSFWVALGWRDVIAVLFISFIGGFIVNQIAFRLGIKDTPW